MSNHNITQNVLQAGVSAAHTLPRHSLFCVPFEFWCKCKLNCIYAQTKSTACHVTMFANSYMLYNADVQVPYTRRSNLFTLIIEGKLGAVEVTRR